MPCNQVSERHEVSKGRNMRAKLRCAQVDDDASVAIEIGRKAACDINRADR